MMPATQTDLIYLQVVNALNRRLSRGRRSLSPILFWVAAGILAYLASELVVGAAGEPRYPLTQFLLLLGVALLIVIYVRWYQPLRDLLTEVQMLIQVETSDGTSWVETQLRGIFSLRSRAAGIITAAVATAALWTIMRIGLPYQQPGFQIVGYAALLPIVWIGAHGTYMALALYRLLYLICEAPIRETKATATTAATFYRLPHPVVEKLYRYYLYNFSLVMVIAYLWLLALILTSPYSEAQRIGFFPFLLVLALYPALSFLWVYWETGKISRKLKAHYIALVNTEVSRAFEALRNQADKEQMDLLRSWMDLQGRLEKMNPTPFGLGTFFSLLIASSSGVVQLGLSALELFGI